VSPEGTVTQPVVDSWPFPGASESGSHLPAEQILEEDHYELTSAGEDASLDYLLQFASLHYGSAVGGLWNWGRCGAG